MSTIPYPMVLMGIYESEVIFYGAHHRENIADKTKTVLEDIYSTDFLEIDSDFISDINYKTLDKQNLYAFYDSYIQSILAYNLKKRNIVADKNREMLLKDISEIEDEIQRLRQQLRSESHFNRQMDLNIQIKRLEKKLKDMEG